MDDDKTEDLDSTESAEPLDSSTPERIGSYRILELLGEGGMGVVYLAEQTEPVRRKVALKIIKHGMDTKQVVARFEAERQALAMMDHPAIAKVYDAGATPRGRPYFAMEHVKGVPITEYCDRHRLTNRQRLKLFQQVCEGVQHAHHKAVIHRDLKPGNVLVSIQDDKPVPKIIDFGVAKATAQKLTEKTMHTQLGVMIGTPAYMSPEQAEMTGQDIDTRTDVYALGVMLYELLVGALPFDMKDLLQAGFESMVRKIREDEPPKPSTRLATLGEHSTQSAKKRQTELPALRRELSGDLDWITMKALEKDRTRRYGSPQDFAADIERYLTDQPVLASPPSVAYRAKKFVRRHRLGVSATALVLGVLVAFAVTTTVQSRRIAREAETSERASEFLADMLGNLDPQVLGAALWKDLRERVAEVRRTRDAPEEEIEAVLASLEDALAGVNATDTALRLLDEQVLARAGKTIEEELGEEPRIAGRLEHTLGGTYRSLGLYSQAERHMKRAAAIREAAFGAEHPSTLSSLSALADIYWVQGRYEDSEPLSREVLDIQRRVLGDDHLDTLISMHLLAWTLMRRDEDDEAESLFRERFEILRHRFGDEHSATLAAMVQLANSYQLHGHYDEALPMLLQVLETRKRVLGDDHPETLNTMRYVGAVYANQGLHGKAEAYNRAEVEGVLRTLGKENVHSTSAMLALGNTLIRLGRYDEAEQLHLDVLAIRKRVLGDDHPRTFRSMKYLADLYYSQGRYDEAETLYLETVETSKRVLGDDHPDTLRSMRNLVKLYKAAERLDETRPLVRALLAARERAAEGPQAGANAKNLYAWELLTCEPADLRDPKAALRFALEASEITNFENPATLDTLSLAYHLTGNTAKAIENQKKAIALLPDGESSDRTDFEAALATFEAALKDGTGITDANDDPSVDPP